MVTTRLAALFAALPLLLAADLRAQGAERGRFSIGGNIGYYTVLGGRLFDDARPDVAPGFEAALRWVPQREFTVGGILQYVRYSSGSTDGDVDRSFISLLLEGRYFMGAGKIQPFLSARTGITFYAASDELWPQLWPDEGFAAGGAGGVRIRAGTSFAIETGVGVTTVRFGDFDAADSAAGTWLSLFAGATAAFDLFGSTPPSPTPTRAAISRIRP